MDNAGYRLQRESSSKDRGLRRRAAFVVKVMPGSNTELQPSVSVYGVFTSLETGSAVYEQ